MQAPYFIKLLSAQPYSRPSPLLIDLVTFVAGALLPLAFAPCNIYIIAFMSPLAWLISLQDSSIARAIWRGWLFGFGFFLIGISWIYISIHVYGNTASAVAALLTLIFIAAIALLFALQASCFVYLFNKKHWLAPTIGFACTWVLGEILRSWIFTGLPWLLLGNSQLHTWLHGYAPIISVYGISFLVACTSGLLCNALRGLKHFICSLIAIVIIFVGGFILAQIHWTKPSSKPLKVSLIQGNIPQAVKWDPQLVSLSLQRYQKLTQQSWDSQLIVFPEGAIPDIFSAQYDFFAQLDYQAKQHHNTLVSGVIMVSAKTHRAYNAIITLGNNKGTYLKRHLVPFGEYVPYQHLLRGFVGLFNLPMSNLSAGPRQQPLLHIGNIPVAGFLCYEIAYLNLMLPSLPQAQLLMTLSDDSWFEHSWAAAQQLQISQMRSLEAGRAQIVVSNSGLTAIINAQGNIVKQAPRDKIFILRGSVQPMQGATPLARFGWMIEFIVLMLLTLICWFVVQQKT